MRLVRVNIVGPDVVLAARSSHRRPLLDGIGVLRDRLVAAGAGLRELSCRAANHQGAGCAQEVNLRIERARQFLRSATPSSTQDEAFKLLGLVWSKVPASEIADQVKRLLTLQRPDGGWAQLPTMTPDAYATGQALYALHVSGASPASQALRNGVSYLLRTQLADGTWFVRSRAFGFQPYFESGFPHGRDQFVSASATAWAVIALAYASDFLFQLGHGFHVFNRLPSGHWLRNVEFEVSLDYVATGLPKAGDRIGDERFLDRASPWSLSLVTVIPLAPLRP
jgi:hypothetical protein